MGSESIRQVIASLGAKVKPLASCIDPFNSKPEVGLEWTSQCYLKITSDLERQ